MGVVLLSQATVVVNKFIETCQLFSYLGYLNLQYTLNAHDYFDLLHGFNIDTLFKSNYIYDSANTTSNDSSKNNSTNNSSSNNSNATQNSTSQSNLRHLEEINFFGLRHRVRVLEVKEDLFDRLKYGDGRFWSNSAILLIINGATYVFSLIFAILFYLFEWKNYKFLNLLYNLLCWNLPIRMFNITSLQLFFYIVLEFNSDYDNTDSSRIALIVFIIFLVGIYAFFFKRINYDYSDLEMEKHYGALWDGTNTFICYKRNYFFLNLGRKILVATFLASVTLSSKTQIIGCFVTCLIFLIYTIFAKPFLSNLEWFFTILMELSFCFILTVIFSYNYISSEKASEKINFGYAIITSLSLFMLATFIFAIIHSIRFVRKVYGIFKTTGDRTKDLISQPTDSTLSEIPALTTKIGHAYNKYKKDVENKKKLIVIYNKEEEEKKQKKEEERQKKVDFRNKMIDVELETKNRMGLQSIFNKQKSKGAKKRDSFEEGEDQDVFDDNVNETKDSNEVIKNRNTEEQKKNNNLEKTLKHKKKKKDSFDGDDDEENKESNTRYSKKKKSEYEMKNFK